MSTVENVARLAHRTAPVGVSRWLKTSPPWVLNFYAGFAAFSCYFCMYAFRKPFAAAEFAGESFLGSSVTLKTALITSQVIGYTISKYAGIKVCSEVSGARRSLGLVGLIAMAQAALLLFGVLPDNWKVLAILLNGLPLGMVWGFVVRYLEGRRASDLLHTTLACSFVVGSAAVKDVGRAFLAAGFSESWMPAVTGLVFLPAYLAAVWMLDQLPGPSTEETMQRMPRVPMNSAARREFLTTLFGPLLLFFTAYVLLTAFRDFRDNFGVEILNGLGYANTGVVFSRTDTPIAIAILVCMASLSFVRNERLGLALLLVVMSVGTVLVGVSTLLFTKGLISGLWWIGLSGLGGFLAYIPFNAMIFDRVVALHGRAATAVFAIYIADAAGYTASVGLQLYKDMYAASALRGDFLQGLASATSTVGTVAIVGGGLMLFRLRPVSIY